MKELLNKIVSQALDAVSQCADSKSLADVRVRFLGKNGEMTAVMKGKGKNRKRSCGKGQKDKGSGAVR